MTAPETTHPPCGGCGETDPAKVCIGCLHFTDRVAQHRQRVIEAATKDIAPGDDGYQHYWPPGKGYLTAHDLRVIASHLDHLNKDWDRQVTSYFEEKGHDAG